MLFVHLLINYIILTYLTFMSKLIFNIRNVQFNTKYPNNIITLC